MKLSKFIEIIKYKKLKALKIISNRLREICTLPLLYIWYGIFYRTKFIYTKDDCKISNDELTYISQCYIEAIKSDDKLGKSGGLWETIIETEYKSLHELLINQNIKGLSNSLKRFGSRSYTRGISLVGDIPLNLKNKINLLQRFISYRKIYESLSMAKNVSFPNDFGGIHCAVIDNKCLQVSSFRHNYYAEKIDALLNVADGDVLEVGGGYGGVCYQLFNNFGFNNKYILVDMPIQLANQAFFLMQALPGKRIVFIANEADLSIAAEADIILLTPDLFKIYAVTESVSLAFNAHSFTEMDFSVAEEYLRLIVKMKPNFILSYNHEMKYAYRSGDSKIKKHSSMLDENITNILAHHYGLISRFPELLQGDEYWEYLWQIKSTLDKEASPKVTQTH